MGGTSEAHIVTHYIYRLSCEFFMLVLQRDEIYLWFQNINIVTWTVKAVSSPCRAEPSRAGPGRAGPRRARCYTELR
jgi:hypothetical protein